MTATNTPRSMVSPWLCSAGLALAALTMSVRAEAAGFLTDVQSGSTSARAGGVVASIQDATSVWHNPAGLAWTQGTEAHVSLTLIRPRGRYRGPGLPSTNPGFPADVDQRADSTLVPVPSAFVSHALSPKAFVGFGFYSPYGLRVAWLNPTEFTGRTVVQEIALRTYFMTPTIALKLAENVSVALGVSLVPASVYLRRTVGAADTKQVLLQSNGEEGEVEISGSAFGVGMTAGLQVALIDRLRLGVTYRSAIALDFTGDANFTLPAGTPASVAANFPDQTGRASITLPHTLGFGVAWKDSAFTVEAAAHVTFWNSTRELAIEFDTGRPTPISSAPRDWRVVPKLGLSGEYTFGAAVVRAGLAYDWSPIPDSRIDPTLPDSDRFIIGLGGGYDFGPIRLDIAYLTAWMFARSVGPEEENPNFSVGTYEGGLLHLVSTSASMKF